MKKIERHKTILKIIEDNRINTQEQLVKELENIGVIVTQATVSRDIKELNLTKNHSLEGSYYVYNNNNEVSDSYDIDKLMGENVIRINSVEYLIVLHTLPGGAPKIAFYLDQSDIKGIIGTIAGDDTVLIITDDIEIAKELFSRWKR